MKLIVKNMNCQNCVKKINDRLERRGLEAVFDLPNKTLEVEGIEVSDVIKTLEAIGYEAELVE